MSVSQPPVQPVPVPHQIRIELFSYEKGCLEAYIENALESIKRSHPTARFEPFNMLTFHRLLEFRTNTVMSMAPAFGFFKLKIKLVQCSSPPEIFFICSFPEAPLFFPGCQQIVANYQNPEMEHTVLNLTTSNGRLTTPPVHQYTQERLVVLNQFSLNILKENLSFSIKPFEVWRQVECQHGFLSFPPNQSLLAPLPDHQQPAPENHQRQPNNPGRARKTTSFAVPPPPLQYGPRGSWTTQNASWDTVPYNPADPNLTHLPFERQHQKSYAPQPIVQPPSRFEYLENFKQSQKKIKEAEHRILQENLEMIALSRTTGSTSPVIELIETSINQKDQTTTSGVNTQASGSTTAVQIHVEKPNSQADNLQTPTLQRKVDLNSALKRRLNPEGVNHIESAGIMTPPLAASAPYSAENPRPVSNTDQDIQLVDIEDEISTPATPAQNIVIGAHNQSVLRFTPAQAAALTTTSQSSLGPKVTSAEETRKIQTRKQAKQVSDRSEQETNALACWLENNKIKATFKKGDKMPEFLVNYSVKILSRANSHPPPDSIAECLTPYLYHSDGIYALSQSDVNFEILNILNALYEFEKDSESTPSKLSNWLNLKIRGQK